MIRYRCPHCDALIAAHERRAGQSSVCKACVKPHPIPSDKSLWLNELGEPLHSPAPAADPFEPAATTPDVEVSRAASQTPELAATLPEIPRSEPTASPRPRAVAAATDEDGAENVNERAETAVATLTPPPARGLPTPATRPAPAREQAEPVELQTQADIAVALTAALTSRMKPRAQPRRDLRLSTAAWMLLTGVGAALVIITLFTDVAYRWPALVIAAAEVVAGYVWIVRLTYHRDPTRGLICAVPPLTVYYLAQYKYAKWRPMRFVLTGGLIATLALLAPSLAPHTRGWVKKNDPPPVPAPDPAAMSKLEQLRHYRDNRSYNSLISLFELLAKTDPLLSEDAKDRAALSAELKALCQHHLTRVKVEAMGAYARWDPDNARAVCLTAVRSPTYEEREKALQLLPQWKDAETAQAVQSLINGSGTAESNRAKAALEEIGGSAAEHAAITLLGRADSQATKLTALSILEKVGSLPTAASLRTFALACDDATLREKAVATAAAIESRHRVPPPAPATTPKL